MAKAVKESQSNKGLYKLLNFAFVYNTWQAFVGGGKARKTIAKKYIRAKPGEKLLDIGCGTGNYFVELEKGVKYVGYDVSEQYIEFARKRYEDEPNAKFHCVGVNDLEELDTDFDIAITIGLLHHLHDEEAAKVIEVAFNHLRPGGRYMLLEPTWTPNQKPIDKFLNKMDRGKMIRTPEAYSEFMSQYFSDFEYKIDVSLYNFPISVCVIEAIKK